MNRIYLDLPEARNRTVSSLRVYEDPPYGREVHIIFTDGTQMSIDIALEPTVAARHYRGNKGDLEILHEHTQKSVSEAES